ncbi:MAG: FHA domain-containing protein [Microbacterium arborescens]
MRPSSRPPAIVGDHDGETVAVADIRSARRGDPAVYESTEVVPARRIVRGRIRISDGQVVELDDSVIVGRRPRSPRASGGALPTLVAVESPEQDISRNHVEIRAEGEHVLVVDLDTTNGSVLLRGGNDPVRLHPSEPTMVVTGDVLDIGDGVTIVFEDLP